MPNHLKTQIELTIGHSHDDNAGDRFINELLHTKLVKEGTYRGERVFSVNPQSIYGGELMSQALMSAAQTIPTDFKPHSLHCHFLNRSDVDLPNDYRVIRFRDGRSFSHRQVEAVPVQSDPGNTHTPHSSIFFRMDCSFKLQEGRAAFVNSMPKVPSPSEVQSIGSLLGCIDIEKLPPIPHQHFLRLSEFYDSSPMESKICEPEYLFGLNSNPDGRLHAWMRLRETPTVPILPYRDAILTYFSDAMLMFIAVTGPHMIHHIATLNQSVWFHNSDVCPDADDWVLLETRTIYLGNSLTLSHGAIWDKRGRLLASITQEGLMRIIPHIN